MSHNEHPESVWFTVVNEPVAGRHVDPEQVDLAFGQVDDGQVRFGTAHPHGGVDIGNGQVELGQVGLGTMHPHLGLGFGQVELGQVGLGTIHPHGGVDTGNGQVAFGHGFGQGLGQGLGQLGFGQLGFGLGHPQGGSDTDNGHGLHASLQLLLNQSLPSHPGSTGPLPHMLFHVLQL